MIAFLLLAQASLAAMEDPAPAADMPSGKWATVRIEPSFAETRTEIAIGTLRYDQQAQQLDYWMRREERKIRGDGLAVRWADSRTCAAMRPAISAMRHVRAMQVAPPGFVESSPPPLDGTLYTLEAPGVFPGSRIANLRITTNVGTSLAAWAERLKADIADCWTTKAPSV